MPKIHLKATIPDTLSGQRLDQALAKLFPDYSRAQHQTWIRSGQVKLNGETLLYAALLLIKHFIEKEKQRLTSERPLVHCG